MKKVRRILCGALAALLLAGCGSGAAGEYAIVETSYPARTQKTEERVDTEELVRFSSETAEVILPAGENAVYAPVSPVSVVGDADGADGGPDQRNR